MLDETSAQLPANGNRRLPTGLTARRPLIDKLEHPPSPESRNPILRKVVRQIAHMTNLVGQVMPRSTSNVNQLQLRFDKVAVSTVLRDLEFELDPIAAAYGIRMEWQFFCPEAQIWADGGAIRHLILILIDNALKFTDGGGTVSVAVRMQGSYCLLEIGDTGCGIDAADLPHLFDRFYGSNSARPTGRGPGLGLPIARAIVHTHHGTIDVASELGAGTLFRVKLPTVPCE